jgi:hypothetical protein
MRHTILPNHPSRMVQFEAAGFRLSIPPSPNALQIRCKLTAVRTVRLVNIPPRTLLFQPAVGSEELVPNGSILLRLVEGSGRVALDLQGDIHPVLKSLLLGDTLPRLGGTAQDFSRLVGGLLTTLGFFTLGSPLSLSLLGA